MADTQKYAQRGRDIAATFLNLSDDALAWRNTYWDRGYNTGGAAEITDAAVEGAGVTAADVTGMITFADALDAFLVANRGYLSKMRNDF